MFLVKKVPPFDALCLYLSFYDRSKKIMRTKVEDTNI